MTDSKLWYESETVRAAIVAFLISAGGVANDAIANKEFTAVHASVVAGGIMALASTIHGRTNAMGSITLLPPQTEDKTEAEPFPVPSPTPTGGNYMIRFVQDSWLKKNQQPAADLDDNQKQAQTKDRYLLIDRWEYSSQNHLKITFAEATWYVFIPHVRLIKADSDTEIELRSPETKPPEIAPEVISEKKPTIRIVGLNERLHSYHSPIYPGSHFTWAEATKGGTRLPESPEITANIIKAAREMDRIRAMLGGIPITVTSWYRPPAVNRAVKGASGSKHLEGHAVDFYSTQRDIHSIQNFLKANWKTGGLGLGASYKGFVHIDLGRYRVWDY